MFCSKCGKEIMDEAVICVHCGCKVEGSKAQSVETHAKAQVEDKVSVGLCVLSVLIPLFGIIYWPLKHKVTPKKAQACGIAGIISWAISFVFLLSGGGF